jgi:P-type Cu2+ transporter
MSELLTKDGPRARAVLHVGSLHYASEKVVVEGVLGRRRGVAAVEANPIAQTATVSFDPRQTSVDELARTSRGLRTPGQLTQPRRTVRSRPLPLDLLRRVEQRPAGAAEFAPISASQAAGAV